MYKPPLCKGRLVASGFVHLASFVAGSLFIIQIDSFTLMG